MSGLLTCSAVFSRFSISKLLVRDVALVPAAINCCAASVGSTNEGAGELSASGEYKSLPVPSRKYYYYYY